MTLLKHPGATGYQVAKCSGIPRVKIREVLHGLEAKDVVSASREEDLTACHPLPSQAVLDRYLHRVEGGRTGWPCSWRLLWAPLPCWCWTSPPAGWIR